MKYRLLDVLVCPTCKSKLELQNPKTSVEIAHQHNSSIDRQECVCEITCGYLAKSVDEVKEDCRCMHCYQTEIIEGNLHCVKCGLDYPIIDRIPYMIPNDPESGDLQVRKRFEFQWKAWGKEERLFGRSEEEEKKYILDGHEKLTQDYFKGKLVLDAGCGHGRFLRSFSKLGAEAIGCDFGSGIHVAAHRNQGDALVHLVKADLLQLPFRTECLDFTFSNGVIHHTHDPKAAFDDLAASTKKTDGAGMFIWVYPKGGFFWETSQKFLRAILTRLPPRLLYYLCFIPVPLLSFVKTYSSTSLKTSNWKQCAQVIYDWYSPKYQYHYTPDELKDWFTQADFGELQRFYIDTGICGFRKSEIV